MEIIGKEYRALKLINGKAEDDITGIFYRTNNYLYIYIYNEDLVYQSLINVENDFPKIFGQINKEVKKIRYSNLNYRINKENDPVSIGRYKLLKDSKIEMRWNYYYGENIELIFKGKIFLEGDAIKGTFYKNGEINVPERVYYNVDKPLPNPLIPEEGEDIL
ncbi:hypothetical protein V5097_03590 [Arenibacter palladensis]|uniref:hypothetical protein n=1 Tax=Arenibacter palladensis TaxID=237373 RepID=UPI002FD33ACA